MARQMILNLRMLLVVRLIRHLVQKATRERQMKARNALERGAGQMAYRKVSLMRKWLKIQKL
jgi:hypothetical protein